jgi:cytochrome d ubiquinol oxidase subunit I
MVTEVGRQPWLIHGVLRVKDAVTPVPGLQVSFFTSVAVYLFLGSVVALLLYRHVVSVPIGTRPEADAARSARSVHAP